MSGPRSRRGRRSSDEETVDDGFDPIDDTASDDEPDEPAADTAPGRVSAPQEDRTAQAPASAGVPADGGTC